MKSHLYRLAFACALAAGCGGQPSPSDSSSDAVSLSSLPDLPGCESQALAGKRYGDLNARPLAGYNGLYVIYSQSTPLCIDTLQDAASVFHAFIVTDWTASNPMPGDPGQPASTNGGATGSNPMPGDPGQAGSNPMPGSPGKTLDRYSSNPMPGDVH
jgi:hypothetical protein